MAIAVVIAVSALVAVTAVIEVVVATAAALLGRCLFDECGHCC